MPKLTKTIDRGQRDWYQKQIWRVNSKAQLQREPLCAMCFQKGRITAATVADHVIRFETWTEFLCGKLQSLCERCHNNEKQMIDRGRPRLVYGLDGWPVEE